ncbi:MAG: hypothetical protein J6U10_09740 [Lachnospiraceae bacterium]|nr:hypothetical protein [Lachnospiraceae bacterium]MBP5184724.1 hypothetical protein [Lachnospiraceae bacterium]
MKHAKTLIITVFILGLLLTACGTKNYDFVIMAGSDNGFVAASREYIAIDGTNVVKINKRTYEKLTLGNTSVYANASPELFSFDANATTSDPATWTITQNAYSKTEYDVAALADDIKAMGVTYVGDVYIVVTKFGDHRIIEVSNLNGSVVLDTTYAIFAKDVLLNMPKGLDLHGIREVRVRI